MRVKTQSTKFPYKNLYLHSLGHFIGHFAYLCVLAGWFLFKGFAAYSLDVVAITKQQC